MTCSVSDSSSAQYLSQPISKIESYANKALNSLNLEQPNWRNPASDQKTICIPKHFETVRENLENPSIAEKKEKNLGDETEQAIFKSLSEMESGGAILVSNLNMTTFREKAGVIWKAYARPDGTVNLFNRGTTTDTDRISPEFQVDFVLFHRRIGIYLLEVKSTSGNGKEIPIEAQQQVVKMRLKMRLLFETINGVGSATVIPMKAVVCCPNNTRPIPKDGPVTHDYDVIYKDDIYRDDDGDNTKTAERLWKIIKKTQMKDMDFYQHTAFQRFIAVICCYRDAIYLNGMKNTIELANMLQEQRSEGMTKSRREKNTSEDSVRLKSFNFNERDSENVFFLTKEQKDIFNCQDDAQLIFGPPGSGKTLIIALKIIQALERNANGKVYVICRADYKAKMERVIEATCGLDASTNVNFIDLKDMAEKIFFIWKNDHVFCDEMSLLFLSFFKSRLDGPGKTVCAFTGHVNTGNSGEIKTIVNRFLVSDRCKLFSLCKVMRGTTKIINHWERELKEESEKLTVGHGIIGPDVKPVKFYPTVTATLKAVLNEVQFLLENGAHPQTIAIITEAVDEAKMIRQYIVRESQGAISVATVAEQVHNERSIAVDNFPSVLSFEWPFVIACSLHCIKNRYYFPESFELIAYSRAIIELVIISRDYMSMQYYIEAQLKAEMNWSERTSQEIESTIKRVARQYLEEQGEIDDSPNLIDICANMHYWITVLRLDIFTFPESSNNQASSFQSCKTFTNCLEVIQGNPAMIQQLFRHIFDHFHGNWLPEGGDIEKTKIVAFYCGFQIAIKNRCRLFSALQMSTNSDLETCLNQIGQELADYGNRFLGLGNVESQRTDLETLTELDELVLQQLTVVAKYLFWFDFYTPTVEIEFGRARMQIFFQLILLTMKRTARRFLLFQ